jgi:hypothetical protein
MCSKAAAWSPQYRDECITCQPAPRTQDRKHSLYWSNSRLSSGPPQCGNSKLRRRAIVDTRDSQLARDDCVVARPRESPAGICRSPTLLLLYR